MRRLLQSQQPEDFLPVKPVVLEVLLALADTAQHGYGILQEIRERSGGGVQLETGPLYRHLKRLLDDGLVIEVNEPEGEPDGDERRRYYALTQLGRKVVALEGARLTALVERGRRLGVIEG